MSKSVFMQVQMAAGLRASFQHAAAREHRSAAQVLQQLMREYVVRQSCVDAEQEAGPFDAVERVAGAVALEGARVARCEPEAAPCFEGGDRDLEAMVARQLGWRCSPFGVG